MVYYCFWLVFAFSANVDHNHLHKTREITLLTFLITGFPRFIIII